MFQPNYCFVALPNNPYQYCIPEAPEHAKFLEDIDHVPGKDPPPIFGLHANADLTFRLQESTRMLNTLMDTQPKDAGAGGGGLSREDQVKEKIEKELLPTLPNDFNFIEVEDRLRVLKGGPKQICEGRGMHYMPLNIFLK